MGNNDYDEGSEADKPDDWDVSIFKPHRVWYCDCGWKFILARSVVRHWVMYTDSSAWSIDILNHLTQGNLFLSLGVSRCGRMKRRRNFWQPWR